ncbi:MAG TPA: hypothetical protein VFB32_02570 [Rudaea sp.]|nr:hypothetical protein [Rudaea sp.]
MHNVTMFNRILLRGAIAVAATFTALALHAETAALAGQWMGNSQIEGEKHVTKTWLTLGAPDAANSTLRLEGDSACTLKEGSYSAGNDGAVTLTFKGSNGGDGCARLAKGSFVLHPGANPRKLEFEASYSGGDGGQSVRRGALSRYP